jgi:hypothetical protein
MSRYLKALFALVTLTLLAACGGGGDGNSFTVNRTWEGTTYSCPTQATFDVCRAGNCTQCTCTVGCDTNAPKVKLAVSMSPSTLPVNQPGTLRLALRNTATVNQTVRFTLNSPAGPVFNCSGWFSTPCDQLELNLGSQSVVAAVMVPANSSCSMDLQKRFTAPASSAAMSLSDLDKVELDGALPSVTVTP